MVNIHAESRELECKSKKNFNIETDNHSCSHSHIWPILDAAINLNCMTLDCDRKMEHAGEKNL